MAYTYACIQSGGTVTESNPNYVVQRVSATGPGTGTHIVPFNWIIDKIVLITEDDDHGSVTIVPGAGDIIPEDDFTAGVPRVQNITIVTNPDTTPTAIRVEGITGNYTLNIYRSKIIV